MMFTNLLKNKNRPKCIVEGCNSFGQNTGNKRKDGSIYYRKECHAHHCQKYRLGDWVYKSYRKEYCENIDGRLGFKCTATILKEHYKNLLDTDHINNNHDDNRECNLQTLCANCHRVKGKLFGHLTSLDYIKSLFTQNKNLFDKKNNNSYNSIHV